MPTPHNEFPIKKQGELDYACSLYCVLSAGIHLRVLPDDTGPGRVLNHSAVGRDLPKRLLGEGAREADVRRLAAAANLQLWRPNSPTIETLMCNDLSAGVWMALVWMRFDVPRRGRRHRGDTVTTGTALDDRHYVLVLEATRSRVVVADPHPWHEDVYAMTRRGFDRAWRRRGYRWAGWLARAHTRRLGHR